MWACWQDTLETVRVSLLITSEGSEFTIHHSPRCGIVSLSRSQSDTLDTCTVSISKARSHVVLRKDQSLAVEYADVRLLQLARVDQHDEDVNTLNERNLNDFGKYLFSGNDAILIDTQQPSTLHFFVSSSYVALAVGAGLSSSLCSSTAWG